MLSQTQNDCRVDCSGAWGGTKKADRCGVCGGAGACKDCAGTPSGNSSKDRCGVCDPIAANDCRQDCGGVWGGARAADRCGVCAGQNSCLDCAQWPWGRNQSDHCGVCDASAVNDCRQDCAGAWGGPRQLDACRVCSGDNSTCASKRATSALSFLGPSSDWGSGSAASRTRLQAALASLATRLSIKLGDLTNIQLIVTPGPFYSLELASGECVAGSESKHHHIRTIQCSDSGGRTIAECARECKEQDGCFGFGYGNGGNEYCGSGKGKCHMFKDRFCDGNPTWHWHALGTASPSKPSPHLRMLDR